MRFGIATYCTMYNSKVDNQVITQGYNYSACFSVLYIYLHKNTDIDKKHHIELSIQVNTDKDFVINSSKNNYSFLTTEEFEYFIKELNKIFDFDYTIEYNEKYIRFHIKASFNYMETKLFTTLFRYCYEYPYSIFLKESIILKMNKKFVNINLFNVYNIISSSYTNIYIGIGHACTGGGNLYKLLNYKTIKERIKEIYSCNDLYHNTRRPSQNFVSMPANIEDNYFSLENVFSRYKETYYMNYRDLQNIENYIQTN